MTSLNWLALHTHIKGTDYQVVVVDDKGTDYHVVVVVVVIYVFGSLSLWGKN